MLSWRNWKTYAEMARMLGLKPTGSNTTNPSARCRQHGIDTSRMSNQGHRKGQQASNKLAWSDHLVLGTPSTGRATTRTIRRCMLEAGVPHICGVCSLSPMWNGAPLTLQIDHMNGQYWDNRLENLRFICPNCHAQTATWAQGTRTGAKYKHAAVTLMVNVLA